jgi:hypothetical protein
MEAAHMAHMEEVNIVSHSQRVRQHVVDEYLSPARSRGDTTFLVNVGKVQKAVRLTNRVSLVCTALESQKFLKENRLRLVKKTGPPSGQSTTVTYAYEFVDTPKEGDEASDRQEAWNRLRGALKDVFAELGGGENYLRNERANFYGPGKDR